MRKSLNIIKNTNSLLLPLRNTNSINKQSDEILNLKREIQHLNQEKNLLRAKIVRLNDISKQRPKQCASFILQNSLEREMKKTQQLCADKRAEIESLKASDRAAIIDELKTECLCLHMEIIRMKKVREESKNIYNKINKQLKETQLIYSKDVLEQQKNNIANIKYQISEQSERNKIIAQKIEEREAGNVSVDERSFIFNCALQNIDQQILEEERYIKEIQDEIDRMKEDKELLIANLEERLRSISKYSSIV